MKLDEKYVYYIFIAKYNSVIKLTRDITYFGNCLFCYILGRIDEDTKKFSVMRAGEISFSNRESIK